MRIDVRNVIAKQEREVNSIEKLWRLKLITRSADVAFFVAYYKLSNAVLKMLLKTQVRFKILLWRIRK